MGRKQVTIRLAQLESALGPLVQIFLHIRIKALRAAALGSALNSSAASGQEPSHHSWVREGVWGCGTVVRG